jgi:Na+:H+ antiporter, NhaA family
MLCGSVVAAALAAVVLHRRNRHYRDVEELEAQDSDADGIPDVYQSR